MTHSIVPVVCVIAIVMTYSAYCHAMSRTWRTVFVIGLGWIVIGATDRFITLQMVRGFASGQQKALFWIRFNDVCAIPWRLLLALVRRTS